jgi:hypothetical protein
MLRHVARWIVNLANLVFHLRNARSEFNWFMNGFIRVAGIIIDGYILYKAFLVAYLGESFQLGKSIVYLSLAWAVLGIIWAVLRSRRQGPITEISARVPATVEGD